MGIQAQSQNKTLHNRANFGSRTKW